MSKPARRLTAGHQHIVPLSVTFIRHVFNLTSDMKGEKKRKRKRDTTSHIAS